MRLGSRPVLLGARPLVAVVVFTLARGDHQLVFDFVRWTPNKIMQFTSILASVLEKVACGVLSHLAHAGLLIVEPGTAGSILSVEIFVTENDLFQLISNFINKSFNEDCHLWHLYPV